MKRDIESNAGCLMLMLVLLILAAFIICITIVVDMDEVRHIPEPFRQYGTIKKNK
jgi:hypothetical protein